MSRPYRIRYFDPACNEVRAADRTAGSKAELEQHCQAVGWVLLEVTSVRARSGPGAVSRVPLDAGWWCRELRTLLLSGMTVVEALETMQAQDRGEAQRAMGSALLKALREGQPLSHAMTARGVFPRVLVASVAASERTSNLPSALADYLQYDSLLSTLRRRAMSAAIYPALVVSVGAAIVAFLLLYVVPRFSRMYGDGVDTLSAPTRAVLFVSRLLQEHSAWLVVALVLLLGVVMWAWQQGRLLPALGACAERIGPLRRASDHFRLANIYQTLALMFKGGYTLDEALAQCEQLQLGSRLQQGVSLAKQRMSAGRAVARSFAEAGLCDPVTERLLGVGERTGGFAAVLQTIAERHSEAFATFVERATRLIEPVLLLIVALFVGGIVVMMYMPIFDIAGGLR